MTCYHPVKAYRYGSVETGYLVTHNPIKGEKKGGTIFHHPCGQCIGCRLDKAREWAIRCVHEASLHKNNVFITLTFSDEWLYQRKQNKIGQEKGLSDTWSLQRGKGSEFELFMKRLRKRFGQGIRFYMCGEYGENCLYCFRNYKQCNCSKYEPTIGRPHYHAILFNIDFSDKQLHKTVNGNRIYTSDTLESIWIDPKSKTPMGNCTLGDVTIDSAGYVARYSTKKITGKMAEEKDPVTGLTHYERFEFETGEVHQLEAEYNNMSRNPGIGIEWIKKFKEEVLINDSVIAKNHEMKVPRYYDKKLEETDPERLEENKQIRLDNLETHADNNTKQRLLEREYIKLQQSKLLPRKGH